MLSYVHTKASEEKQENRMNFEFLPNDILFEVFEYFNGVDLLRAFLGLNYRFNYLIYEEFQTYRFDFTSISEYDFGLICQYHLPCIADRIISLTFFDNDDAREKVNLFFSYVPSFNIFTHLRALSILSISSSRLLMEIVNEFHHLYNLTHLTLCFHSCDDRVDDNDVQSILNTIWNIPKLIYYKLQISTESNKISKLPTVVCPSLKSVDMFDCSNTVEMNTINQMFQYISCLTRLSIALDASISDNYVPFTISTLIHLNIDVSHASFISLSKLFQNTPNLYCLNIDLNSVIINGIQWEQIIRNYLRKLQVFRLVMKKQLSNDENINEVVDELIKSFQGSFWIDEHQWYIRCYTQCSTIYKCIHLSTLSKARCWSLCQTPQLLKSTDPRYDDEEFYNKIAYIDGTTFFDEPIPSHIRLMNIKDLTIKLPINDQFWFIIPNLSRLTNLRVSSYADEFQSQLQTLLDRAHNLLYLSICRDSLFTKQISFSQFTNGSVRKLDLIDIPHFYSEEDCIKLCHSPLGIQCEVLHIIIEKRNSIIYMVENMVNLRSLHVYCADDRRKYRIIESVMSYLSENRGDNQPIEDELSEWLIDRLPPTCVISRGNDFSFIFPTSIRIWIEQQ
jgi:hypothetical protein